MSREIIQETLFNQEGKSENRYIYGMSLLASNAKSLSLQILQTAKPLKIVQNCLQTKTVHIFFAT